MIKENCGSCKYHDSNRTAFDRDAWCKSAIPEVWPEVVRIRSAAGDFGLVCLTGISGDEDRGDPPEMVLTFYQGGSMVGCASWDNPDDAWSWYLRDCGIGDSNNADALISALRRLTDRLRAELDSRQSAEVISELNAGIFPVHKMGCYLRNAQPGTMGQCDCSQGDNSWNGPVPDDGYLPGLNSLMCDAPLRKSREHDTRFSDSSCYDEVCKICGLTDDLYAGSNIMNTPCIPHDEKQLLNKKEKI